MSWQWYICIMTRLFVILTPPSVSIFHYDSSNPMRETCVIIYPVSAYIIYGLSVKLNLTLKQSTHPVQHNHTSDWHIDLTQHHTKSLVGLLFSLPIFHERKKKENSSTDQRWAKYFKYQVLEILFVLQVFKYLKYFLYCKYSSTFLSTSK